MGDTEKEDIFNSILANRRGRMQQMDEIQPKGRCAPTTMWTQYCRSAQLWFRAERNSSPYDLIKKLKLPQQKNKWILSTIISKPKHQINLLKQLLEMVILQA